MEGGFPFGMFGDPSGSRRPSGDGRADAARSEGRLRRHRDRLAVQMTVACINRLDLSGTPEAQAAQVRDAIRVLFPEADMLVREAREGSRKGREFPGHPRARRSRLRG